MPKGDINKYKNDIIGKLIINENLIKALINSSPDFLDVIPTSEQTAILNDSTQLLYTQIFPYRNITTTITEDKVYITSLFGNFNKKGISYKDGMVYFYVIVPNSWVRTSYGNRHDFILDEIESMFTGRGIGKFEFNSRGDMPIDNKFIGGVISFSIIDFA